MWLTELVWQSAREQAQAVLDDSWDQELPVNIEAICKAYGVNIYKRRMPNDLSGMIVKRAHNDTADAFIDMDEPDIRQRFTLAHELGHFIERTKVAHDDEFGFQEIRSSSLSEDYFPHEFFADEFAGSLLIPRKKLSELQKQGKAEDEIAKAFKVSVAALRKRISSLTTRSEDVD